MKYTRFLSAGSCLSQLLPRSMGPSLLYIERERESVKRFITSSNSAALPGLFRCVVNKSQSTKRPSQSCRLRNFSLSLSLSLWSTTTTQGWLSANGPPIAFDFALVCQRHWTRKAARVSIYCGRGKQGGHRPSFRTIIVASSLSSFVIGHYAVP